MSLPDLLDEYFQAENCQRTWQGEKIGIVLIGFDENIVKRMGTQLHKMRARRLPVTVRMIKLCDMRPTDWGLINRYWRTLLLGTELDDYLIAKEFYGPCMNAWMKANHNTQPYKKKAMAPTYSTENPPDHIDEYRWNLCSLVITAMVPLWPRPEDWTPQIRHAMAESEDTCGGRTMQHTRRSFGTSKDDRRVQLIFTFFDDVCDDITAVAQMAPMISAVETLRSLESTWVSIPSIISVLTHCL